MLFSHLINTIKTRRKGNQRMKQFICFICGLPKLIISISVSHLLTKTASLTFNIRTTQRQFRIQYYYVIDKTVHEPYFLPYTNHSPHTHTHTHSHTHTLTHPHTQAHISIVHHGSAAIAQSSFSILRTPGHLDHADRRFRLIFPIQCVRLGSKPDVACMYDAVLREAKLSVYIYWWEY